MNLTDRSPFEGTVFDIQRFSVHDGPGIRTTVFMKGCPLQCEWCHNPEGLSGEARVRFLDEACIGCESCVDNCKGGGRSMKDGQLSVDFDDCVGCGECVRRCPSTAAQWCGDSVTPENILAAVLKDQVYYADKGGVTFSGGEPLQQADFVVECLKLCKEHDLNTTIDTSGLAPWSRLEATLPFCDHYLFDIKAINPETHAAGTGVDNALIRENLAKLAEANARIWVRVPVVDGFNNSADEMEAIADFLVEVGGIEQVTLMPYHTLGKSKYDTFGSTSPMGDRGAVSNEKMQRWAELFAAKGLTVVGANEQRHKGRE